MSLSPVVCNFTTFYSSAGETQDSGCTDLVSFFPIKISTTLEAVRKVSKHTGIKSHRFIHIYIPPVEISSRNVTTRTDISAHLLVHIFAPGRQL
jgi:hypothetical protein